MAEGACGSGVSSMWLMGVEGAASNVISDYSTAGLPYLVTVEVGFVIRESEFDNNVYIRGRQSYFNGLQRSFRYPDADLALLADINPKDRLLLFGATGTEPMKRARTPEEFMAALFRRETADPDVAKSLMGELKRGCVLVVALFDPPGGIPDDIYDDFARRLYELGAANVYNQDRLYDRTYYALGMSGNGTNYP